jgi:Tfp pilus assembly protein PilW
VTRRPDVRSTLRRIARDERGLSLAELIVAVVVTLVLLSLVFGFFMIGNKSIVLSRSASIDSGTASNAMNEMSRVVRSGSGLAVKNQTFLNSAFLAASQESVTLYSYVDSPTTAARPIIVQFSLDAQRNLVEKRWLPTGTDGDYFLFNGGIAATPTTIRRLGGPIAGTPTGQPQLFTFQSTTGAMTPQSDGTILAANLASIVGVQIDVRVNTAASGTVPIPIEMRNTVLLANPVS